MNSQPPKIIAINHDDYHAEYVGITSNGSQFFVTALFQPAIGEDKGCEYISLFLFSPEGKLLEAEVENFGPRETMDNDKRTVYRNKLLEKLGDVTYQRIEVEPFSVKRFGVEMGLIPRELEDEDDIWVVELLPGNFMAFFEPWESGEYDT